MRRAIAYIHAVMHVSTSVQLHLKRLWANHCLSMSPLGTTVHVSFILAFFWQVNMKKNMLTQKGQDILRIVHYLLLLKLLLRELKTTISLSWVSKQFHRLVHRELKAHVLMGKCISPLPPDTGRSDIIIYGQSCWQRNANIDLEAQSITKLTQPWGTMVFVW